MFRVDGLLPNQWFPDSSSSVTILDDTGWRHMDTGRLHGLQLQRRRSSMLRPAVPGSPAQTPRENGRRRRGIRPKQQLQQEQEKPLLARIAVIGQQPGRIQSGGGGDARGEQSLPPGPASSQRTRPVLP